MGTVACSLSFGTASLIFAEVQAIDLPISDAGPTPLCFPGPEP